MPTQTQATPRRCSNGYIIDVPRWLRSCEEQFSAMVDGLSWDPADESDNECIMMLQGMADEWCEAVTA